MRFPTLVVAAAATLALAACGSDDDTTPAGDGAASSTATTGTAASAAPGPFPVSLTHSFGRTEIDEAPSRVATIGFNEADFALALGVQPIAERQVLGDFDATKRPWISEAARAAKPVSVGSDEIEFEKLAGARPDVILGIYSFIDAGAYGKLRQIAPTVAQGKQYELGAEPWDQQLLDTGKALGREAQAKRIVGEVDSRFDAATKEHPEFAGKTLTVAFEGGGTLFNLADSDLRQQYFTDLGFKTPEGAGVENISKERLDVLDQDVLVLITDDPDGISDDPLFERLDVAKEGRVVTVATSDAFAGALGFNSPLSRPFLLDQAVPRLAAAVDGDPGTAVEATE
ncbi:ABC transporter substrate-binding protein [Patulibacter sp.]|uniref:ABC transporter substrate-binding protein n=1 Tax=Patulibacter sp. TaxID=1912859 RepID=UPI00271847AE|nr:ABC transporter substrate-binding protein [Patulibacter sp.]MDO9409475.1 ABC transporter substrate-binding protein [Patulibacter sp.]